MRLDPQLSWVVIRDYGHELFTNDEYDGDLERYGPTADLREDCMDAAEKLAELYRDRASAAP